MTREKEANRPIDVAGVNVAIVANPTDRHGQLVEAWLATNGFSVVRFNLVDLRKATLQADSQCLRLRIEGHVHELDGTTTVWWNRAGHTPTDDLGPEEGALVSDENIHLLIGLLDGYGVRWVDRPDVVARAEKKLFQLGVAENLEIRTPNFQVTNDPETARAFAATGRVVTKPLSPGVGIAPYTSEIQTGDLASVAVNPALLQRLVDSKVDLRVVTIGGSGWAWARPREGTTIDWRQVDPTGVGFKPTYDETLLSLAGTMTKALGLTMSTQDWLIDSDGHVLLEINPQGAWLFLAGADEQIVKALGQHLTRAEVETKGCWPDAIKRVGWDFLSAKKAPKNDGIVAPTFLDPPWIDEVATWDGVLDLVRRANDQAEGAVQAAEEKAARLVQVALTLIAVATGLTAFQMTAAVSGTWPGVIRWGALLPVGAAIGALSLAAFEATQIDRVGFFRVGTLNDLAGYPAKSFRRATVAAEERGRRLARWTADHKHTDLMQARAWFTRGLAGLIVAALVGAFTFGSGQPPKSPSVVPTPTTTSTTAATDPTTTSPPTATTTGSTTTTGTTTAGSTTAP